MSIIGRAWRWMRGKPKDLEDPRLFHKLALVPFLAWVGLGADGLSSSAYGPDETFRALGAHTYLAPVLAIAAALTVFVISAAYSRLIEQFPSGGGGYLVASKLLGGRAGLVSGAALLVDYVLTISVSVASGGDQLFSLLPLAWQAWKVHAEVAAILGLLVLNIRGVKESVSLLVPVFLLFIATHAAALLGAFFAHGSALPQVAARTAAEMRQGLSALGLFGMFALLARAFVRGSGTYTGIEAVSNGMQTMREPRVANGRRTMLYMAVSLALTAGGILLAYLLLDVRPEAGKTLNAVMAERLPFGRGFVVVLLASEAALLMVAAQTGFIDGPRVMANMALDSWLPRRFSALSDRLTMHYGITLIGAAAIATLVAARGSIDRLVTMYSINVFLTFSLSMLAMGLFSLRHASPRWRRRAPLFAVALALCSTMLVVIVGEKLREGGWVTVAVTVLVIAACAIIRHHYRTVAAKMNVLAAALGQVPAEPAQPAPPLDRKKPTAVLLVGSYGGLGIHSLLTIFRQFPGYFPQAIFVSVAVLDSGSFKGEDEVEHLKEATASSLNRYVALARGYGLAAESRMAVGTEAVAEAEQLCREIAAEYPRSTFFAGRLVFQRERWYQRLLHNETAYAIQGRLQWEGLPMVILPIRVRE